MGIGPATIKSKSQPVQPFRWFGYRYNVWIGAAVPVQRPYCLRGWALFVLASTGCTLSRRRKKTRNRVEEGTVLAMTLPRSRASAQRYRARIPLHRSSK